MQTTYSAQRLVVAENPGEGTGAICFAHPFPASLLSQKYIILLWKTVITIPFLLLEITNHT